MRCPLCEGDPASGPHHACGCPNDDDTGEHWTLDVDAEGDPCVECREVNYHASWCSLAGRSLASMECDDIQW